MDKIAESMTRKVHYVGRHYRNEKLAGWVIGTFKTAEEQRAAWETIKFIRENWPDAEVALRGTLIGTDDFGD